MNSFLILDYPYWFILLCILIGAGYAFVLYSKEKLISNKYWKYTLALSRAILISLILFFLLVPVIKKKSIEEIKPIIVFIEDNSMSVAEQMNKDLLKKYRLEVDNLIEKLQDKFLIKKYSFGEGLNTWEAPNYKEKTTNISKTLKDLQRQVLNYKVGGVILATDGIFNEGNNPIYESATLQTSFYTIGLGDTTQKRDLKIAQLRYNNIVYKGDFFQLEIDVSAYNLEGNTSLLQVFNQDNTLLFSEELNVKTTNFFTTKKVNIEAKTVGVSKYKVSVSSISGEVTTVNNVSWAYVDALEGKQKVLLLYDAPHPDIKAIGRMIEDQKNYEFTSERIGRFNGNLDDYNTVILHGLPSLSYSLSSYGSKLSRQNVFYIISSNTDFNQFNSLQKTLQVQVKGNQKNEVLANYNKRFTNFILPINLNELMLKFPPLIVPFGDFVAAPMSNVLLYQKIGSVETDYPLLVLANNSGIKSAVLAGEGIWRWFLYDKKELLEEGAFKEIFGKTIRYLSLKEDKRKFKLNIPQNVIGENKAITMTAELYNDNFEPIVQPDVSVVIKSQDGKEYLYIMDKSATYYSLDAGKLPVGDYTITASTQFNNQELKATSKLSIEPVQLEQLMTQANHELLKMISDNSGGAFAEVGNIVKLEQLILNDVQLKPILSESFKIRSLLDLKWLFFLILSMLSFEWIVRKWFGTY